MRSRVERSSGDSGLFRLVARGLDRRDQRGDLAAFDLRRAAFQIDRDLRHAGNALQRLLRACLAAHAHHARNLQLRHIGFLLGRIICII